MKRQVCGFGCGDGYSGEEDLVVVGLAGAVDVEEERKFPSLVPLVGEERKFPSLVPSVHRFRLLKEQKPGVG